MHYIECNEDTCLLLLSLDVYMAEKILRTTFYQRTFTPTSQLHAGLWLCKLPFIFTTDTHTRSIKYSEIIIVRFSRFLKHPKNKVAGYVYSQALNEDGSIGKVRISSNSRPSGQAVLLFNNLAVFKHHVLHKVKVDMNAISMYV